jgi:hypothetical protein
MVEKRNEGLLVEAEPLDVAEQLCDRAAEVRVVVDGKLLLEANPVWAGAINEVFVNRGVRVNEIRCVGSDGGRPCPPPRTAVGAFLK